MMNLQNLLYGCMNTRILLKVIEILMLLPMRIKDYIVREWCLSRFAIPIRQNLYITKKKSEADFVVGIDSRADTKVTPVKELKDPHNTHKYSFNTVITAISERLKKSGIKIGYEPGFNKYVLGLVIDFYDIKQEPKYAYKHVIGKQEQYTYSQQFIDFIIDEIKKNPKGFVASLKKSR